MTDETAVEIDEPSSQTEPLQEARELLGGLWSGRVLYAAAGVGLIDELGPDPKGVSELADSLDLHTESTYRVLRALAHYGVAAEHADRAFSLTPAGAQFQRDARPSLRADLRLFHCPEWLDAMRQLPDILREGTPDGFARATGETIFEYMSDNPEFADRFNAFMTATSRRQLREIDAWLPTVEFEPGATVCDVAGGQGLLLCHILASQPELRGVVFDRPSVVSDVETPAEFGVDDRCQFAGGDMFESVPAADVYLLKWVLHNWDDEACVDLLSTLRESAPQDGRLLVIEAVVPGPGTPHFAKHLDMTMLVQMGGRERTETEYRSLFEAAGWELDSRWDGGHGPLSVLEATPA